MLRVNFLDPHPVTLIFFAVGPRSAKHTRHEKRLLRIPIPFYSPVFGTKPFDISSLFIRRSEAGKLASHNKPLHPRGPALSPPSDTSPVLPVFLKAGISITGTVIIIIAEGHRKRKLLAVMGSLRNPLLHLQLILLGPTPAPAPVLSPRSQVRYSILQSCLRSSGQNRIWYNFNVGNWGA